jgi:gas vesicle protein
MKFIVGLATGMVLGAAGAVAYSVKSGQDLREAYQSVRSDIEKGDLDALGARFESGFAELQALMEERINQVKASTASAIDDANKAIDEARAQAAATAERSGNGFAHVADEAAAASESAISTASDAADTATDAATDAVANTRDAIEGVADDAASTIKEHTDS